MIKTAVLGGGSWGTALARELALNKHDTTMYIRDESQLNELRAGPFGHKTTIGLSKLSGGAYVK